MAIKLILLPFDVFFEFLKILYSAVIKMVIGIKNSIMPAFTVIIPKTDRTRDSVCPMVNSVTNSKTFFQSLKI
jgi:hypothetical protein